MSSASAPPRASERYPELIARLWAAGTNSADMARILDLPEAEVERLRLAAIAQRWRREAATTRERPPDA